MMHHGFCITSWFACTACCSQMNVNDSEVVLAVLSQAGYGRTDDPSAASVILCNTCAIRENAEAKVRRRPLG